MATGAAARSSHDLPQRVLIVGGGPAGFTCAQWLHHFGVPYLLVDCQPALGGTQRLSGWSNRWVPFAPGLSGQDVAQALQRHAAALDMVHVPDTTVECITHDGTQFAAACRTAGAADTPPAKPPVTPLVHALTASHVVLATGLSPRQHPLATVHGPFFPRHAYASRRVAIIGGGDNAFENALALRDHGAHVTLYHRGAPHRAPRARPEFQRRAAEYGMRVQPLDNLQPAQYDAVIGLIGWEKNDGLVDHATRDHPHLYRAGDIAVGEDRLRAVITAMASGAEVAKTLVSAL